MKKIILLLMFTALIAAGCGYQHSDKSDKGKTGERVGTLAKEVWQHPLVAPPGCGQFYFDIEGASRQIIVIYREGMPLPDKPEKKIRLKGKIGRVSLGGKPGTPQSYSNETLTLESWEYVD